VNGCRAPRKQECVRCGSVFFDCERHDLCPVCELDPDGMLP
jgi:hypothetical protein